MQTTDTFFSRRPEWPGYLILLVSLLIFLGWWVEIPALVSPFGMGVSRFNTGVMAALLAGCLITGWRYQTTGTRQRASRFISPLLVLALLIFSGLTGWQYLTGQNTGIDQWLVNDWMPPEQGKYPGRPSPATTLCFFTLGCALVIRLGLSYTTTFFEPPEESKTSSEEGRFPGDIGPKLWCKKNLLLALYASLILAIGFNALISLLLWLTGSSKTVFSNLSLGQSLLTSSLLLIACSALISDLLRHRSAERIIVWLPLAILSSFIFIGLILAQNIAEKQKLDFKAQIRDYLHNITLLADVQIKQAQQDLYNLSWRSHDELLTENHQRLEQRNTGLLGLQIRQQKNRIQRFGKAITVTDANCTSVSPQVRWQQNDLLLNLRALPGNPRRDTCLQGLYDYNSFLLDTNSTLDLDFRLVRVIPLNSAAKPGFSQDILAEFRQQPKAGIKAVIGFRERLFSLQLQPKPIVTRRYQRNLTPLLLSLSAIIGVLTALMTYLLLRSRQQFRVIEQANKKLIQLESRNRTVLELAPEAVILVNNDGTIIYANQRCFEIFGYSARHLTGQTIDILLPEGLHKKHRRMREDYNKHPVAREMGANLALSALHHDGHEFPVDIVLSPIAFEDEKVVMAIVRDISDKVKEKQQIERNLHEKEILLKEVYHRVKNNMQVIASLLRMQSRSARQAETRASLNEASQRISALALVHEKLYQSDNLARTGIHTYIDSLCESFRQSHQGSNKLQFQLNIAEEEFEPEVIIPIGLIINELLSNCLKHAFRQMQEQETGRIQISFTATDNEHYQLAVCDNGPGLPQDFDLQRNKTLGLKLIRSLSQQLKAQLSFSSSDQGTCFRLDIPRSALQPSASPLIKDQKTAPDRH